MTAAVPKLTKSIVRSNLHPDWEVKFWSYLPNRPENGCWEWFGPLGNLNYGTICCQGKRIFAHRLSWAIHHEVCPADRCIAHKCDNPRCVRPDHLFLATLCENAKDMWSKGRAVKSDPSLNYLRKSPELVQGIKNPKAKLTDEQVIEMRRLHASGVNSVEIAARFNVNKSTAQRIVYGKLWKHLLK